MNLLQIERIFYPIETLGYGKRIGIWTIGCSHGCYNCCNPELWDSNPNKNLSLSQVFTMLKSITQPVDGVTISGGDPFQQLEELDELVSFIAAEITDDILIYTGYTLKQLQSWNNDHVTNIIGKISVLIDGKYVDHLNDNRSLRGSSNQQIHLLNEKYQERYQQQLQGNRKVQTVSVNQDILAFGIPVKQTKSTLQEVLPQYGITMKDENK